MGLLDTALADGRCWSRVGDCFEVTRKPPGLRVADYKAVPFVPMEAIPQGGQYEPRYDQKPGADITSGTYFERGDLLIAKITPSFENGKQAWVKRLPAPFGYATTEVIPLRPTAAGYDRRLLFFYLLHPEIRSYVSERMEGSTGRQRVPEQVLLDLPYPKLPPDDQQAIADALERVTLQVDLEEHSARTAAELKRAAMRELFTRGLRGEPQKETEIGPAPESWQIKAIGHVFEIVQGLSLKGNLSGGSDGVPFLRTSNVYWGHIDLKNVSRMHVAPELIGDRWLRLGDLLVCEGGEIGRAAVWESKEPGYTYQNHLHRLRPLIGGSIEPKFAAAWLEVGFCHRKVYEGAGNKTTIPNLSRARLAELPMPVPAIDEQRDIVAILDAIDRKIELHRKKRAVLEELFKALLHKLMTGEVRVDALDLSALQAHAGPVSPAAEPAV